MFALASARLGDVGAGLKLLPSFAAETDTFVWQVRPLVPACTPVCPVLGHARRREGAALLEALEGLTLSTCCPCHQVVPVSSSASRQPLRPHSPTVAYPPSFLTRALFHACPAACRSYWPTHDHTSTCMRPSRGPMRSRPCSATALRAWRPSLGGTRGQARIHR